MAQGRRILLVRPSGGTYQQITEAIFAANPGDTIRVATGTYLPILLDKGVSILADPGAAPVILGESRIEYVPASQTIVLAGLTFRSRTWTQIQLDDYALFAESNGPLFIFGCRFETGPVIWRGTGLPRPEDALFIALRNEVLLQDVVCVGASGTNGLLVDRRSDASRGGIVINGGSYRGGDADSGIPGWTPPGVGLSFATQYSPAGCYLYLSDVDIEGGSIINNSPEAVAGTGLAVDGIGQLAPVFVRAGTHTIRGGRGGLTAMQRGGDGLYLGQTTLYHDGFPFVAGAAGGPGGPGQVVRGPGTLTPRLFAEIAFDTPWFDRGVPTQLTFTARPSEPYFLALAFDVGLTPIPGIPEPILVFSTPNWFAYGYFLTDGNGRFQSALTAPQDLNLVGLPVFFQGFGLGPGQIVVSPLAGASIR